MIMTKKFFMLLAVVMLISVSAMAQSNVRKGRVNRTKQVSTNNVKKQPAAKLEEDNEVYVVVEELPEFPGGDVALMTYIQKNINYPADAAKNGIQGRVTVSFIVEKDGSLSDFVIIRSPDPSLSKEVIRVLSFMPKWKPGKQNGKIVRVKWSMPVTFKLP